VKPTPSYTAFYKEKDIQDWNDMLKDAEQKAVSLIKKKLGISLKYSLKVKDGGSNTFDDSVEITPHRMHLKDPGRLSDTVLHELCHVIDNTQGREGRWGQKIQISQDPEWLKIDRRTAPDSYARTASDEDFVRSLQCFLYGQENDLTKDRLDFLKKTFKI
jgi:predicted SprT family Zn-dependent metalloprotease